jgi:hypothetical protein
MAILFFCFILFSGKTHFKKRAMWQTIARLELWKRYTIFWLPFVVMDQGKI